MNDVCMKVYIVNINNCCAYSEYYESNRGVYATRAAALKDLTAMGFDHVSKRRKMKFSWYSGDDWEEWHKYDEEEYRIEEWELIIPRMLGKTIFRNTRAKQTCRQERLFNLMRRECDGELYQWHEEEKPNYCPNYGAKVVDE